MNVIYSLEKIGTILQTYKKSDKMENLTEEVIKRFC